MPRPVTRFGVVPPGNLRIPRRHEAVKYLDIVFIVPEENSQGPFYAVTRGLLIGVFATWLVARRTPSMHLFIYAIGTMQALS
jgi:hypothetical protein